MRSTYQAKVTHKSGFAFEGSARGHTFKYDISAPQGGTDTGPTPKEALLGSIMSCSAMDVVSILKKHAMVPDLFEISSEAETGTAHPRVFKQIDLVFELKGAQLTAEKVIEAVEASMTKYCGVSAMVCAVSPMIYKIILNSEVIFNGKADFSKN